MPFQPFLRFYHRAGAPGPDRADLRVSTLLEILHRQRLPRPRLFDFLRVSTLLEILQYERFKLAAAVKAALVSTLLEILRAIGEAIQRVASQVVVSTRLEILLCCRDLRRYLWTALMFQPFLRFWAHM